jgi:hypothetical protein
MPGGDGWGITFIGTSTKIYWALSRRNLPAVSLLAMYLANEDLPIENDPETVF